MKTLFLALLLSAGFVHAADFSPTPMTISVQPQLEYKFDGSPLEIPFTLTGKSGAIWLVINTNGQADNIVNVRNGYLGWHYVNKIDTTIYISDRFERQPGENILTWDGKDENGNRAEPGSYDYYLWGYDDKSDRKLVCNFIQVGYSSFYQACQIYEKGPDGLPLANPMIMGCQSYIWSKDYEEIYKRTGTNYKWTIGSDPNDVNLLQTTICAMYNPKKFLQNNDFLSYSGSVLNPKDYSVFYQLCFKHIPFEGPTGIVNIPYGTLLKWEFVPGGEAVLDNNWFGWDTASWAELGVNMSIYPTCFNDNNYIYIDIPSRFKLLAENKIRCIDYNGNILFDKDFKEWYMPNVTYRDNCSIEKMYSRNNNKWLISSNLGCMHQLINTSRLLEDPEDETDMVIFSNSNGDYFMDNGWQANIDNPWFCVPDDDDYSIKRNSISIDSNNFNIFFIGNYGISSFGVSTQDGTGIANMNFNDDNPDSRLGEKGGGQLCDSGSAYDGLYIHGKTDSQAHWTDYAQTYYMAFDSAHGLITNNPAVQEQNPLQFKVSQNTPNPFNPSTTISFSIPEKSNVTIDIYNITGQKIKTLINGPMSAGEHSVKWDANGFSAGVYFYKVKAGKFERTMRMTLLK